jgi:undecaprenyl-phosphate 4-deoxy-4-formamido-L-arabinose transferase
VTNGSAAPALSIVIPLYRDQDALVAIFERCGAVMDGIEGGAELVLVDDGGLDATTPRAVALAKQFRHPVQILRLARNFGQHPAVFAGLDASHGNVVVVLDSDLQYPPEDIRLLLGAMDDAHPVVSGYRADRQDPLARRLITRILTNYLNRRTGAKLRDFGSMFRAYDRATVELMLTFTERHRYVPAVVAWLGVPIKEVPISHQPRTAQGSRYRLSALVELTLDLITGYSVFPLRVVTALGVVGSIIGLAATVGFGIYRLTAGQSVSATTSAFALVFFLLAIQLIVLALTGEYVGRVYTEAKGRPYYLVRDRISIPRDDETVSREPGSTETGTPISPLDHHEM